MSTLTDRKTGRQTDRQADRKTVKLVIVTARRLHGRLSPDYGVLLTVSTFIESKCTLYHVTSSVDYSAYSLGDGTGSEEYEINRKWSLLVTTTSFYKHIFI